MAQTRIAGYPQSAGAKVECILEVDGPASYTAGTGNTIDATAAGMKYIEYVAGGISTDGTYTTIGKVTGTASTATLLWFTRTTGAEVGGGTNLSASKVRILVRGFL